MERKIKCITVSSGFGAPLQGCGEGPEILKDYFESSYSLYPNKNLGNLLSIIKDLNQQVSDLVEQTLQEGNFPLVIGGDHSVGAGTWRGVAQYCKRKGKPLGLIWLDAHMDANNPETSPSQAFHGMPLRALLDKDHILLSKKEQILKPEQICLIGVRSYDEGEMQYLQDSKVKIYFIDEVKKRGLNSVLKEAIALIGRKTQAYGVSLDVDLLDPKEAPGVGSPAHGGILRAELLNCLQLISNDNRLIAFELVEFNPDFDRENQTLQLCLDVLRQFYVGSS